MSMMHHAPGPVCDSCEDKLKQARPELAEWFRNLKKQFPDAHIAWSYRDKASQEDAFSDGKSLLHYPNSPHNKTKPDGTPCSMALDLFQLNEQKRALFPWPWYELIWKVSQAQGAPILWGGHFKKLGDADHFQLVG